MSEAVDPQQARRDQGPLTDRGVQRRDALLSAARRVFETKGFVEARVSDIVREAKVSQGTFYTYFDTKEAVFTAVARGVVDAMLLLMAPPVPDTDFHDRITDSVRRFLHAYRPHARMIGLIEQVGTFSPEMRDLRLDLRETFVRRTERGIARLVDAGATRADIDVEYTAEVLGAMLEYTCYVWFSLGREFDEERLVATLSDVWVQALSPAAG